MASSTSSETLTTSSSSSLRPEEDDGECYEERLTEEEMADLSKTLQILALAQAHYENEELLQRQEELDMKTTMDMLTNNLSETEARILKGDIKPSNGKYVHFSHSVKVHVLPSSERVEARNSRKRYWGAGPEHDELWDGDTGSFRDVELTPEQLATIMRRRSKVSTRIKSYFMGRDVKIDGQAHAKLITDEIEDEEPVPTMQKRTSMARLLSFVRGKSSTTRRCSKDEDIIEDLREGSVEMENDWIDKVLKESETYVDEEKAY